MVAVLPVPALASIRFAPSSGLIVRSNFFSQVEPMYKLGADLVLSQDLETSLMFLNHILKFYNLPDHIIRIQTNILKKEHYNFFTENNFDDKWKITDFDKIEKDNEMFFISAPRPFFVRVS